MIDRYQLWRKSLILLLLFVKIEVVITIALLKLEFFIYPRKLELLLEGYNNKKKLSNKT